MVVTSHPQPLPAEGETISKGGPPPALLNMR